MKKILLVLLLCSCTQVESGESAAELAFGRPSYDQTITVGQSYSKCLEKFLIEKGTNTVWAVEPLPAGLTLDVAHGKITGKPTSVGNTVVKLTAIEPGMGVAQADLVFHILPNGNQAPVWDDSDPRLELQLNADVPLTLVFNDSELRTMVSDDDGDALTFDFVGQPSWLVKTVGNGVTVFTGTATKEQLLARNHVTARVSDGTAHH
jgi:hypothetical protein